MEQSPSGRLRWTIKEPFGVEVKGDLSQPLSQEDGALFRKLFYDNSLLAMRGQRLDMEQQIRMMEYIGPVLRSPETVSYVSTEKEIGALGRQELQFHSDIAWLSHPRRAGSLHAVEVVDGKSYTAFANSVRGYAKLPGALKERLWGLVALQMHSHYVEEGRKAAIGKEINWNMPHAYHPVVMTHPVTQRPILYISPMDTIAFTGMDKDEMVSLAEQLFEHLYDRGNIVEHWWCNGDVVIWDNLALQHARGDCADVGVRTLQRVAIGDKSMKEMDPRLDQSDPKIKEFLSNAYGAKAKEELEAFAS